MLHVSTVVLVGYLEYLVPHNFIGVVHGSVEYLSIFITVLKTASNMSLQFSMNNDNLTSTQRVQTSAKVNLI